MKRFGFYFKYAWRSVIRGGRLSVTALLCLAIGVATLVALQSLTISIRDTFTGDIQARAGGDIVAHVNYETDYQLSLYPQAAATLDKFKTQGQIVDWTGLNSHTIQITGYFNVPPSVYIVDPKHFPLYGKIPMVAPVNGDFNKLLAQPNSIIVSKSLWQTNHYQLGQEIEVSGVTDFTNPGTDAVPLKIVGVIDPTIPGVNFDTGLFVGFGIISQDTAATFLDETEIIPTTLYVKTAPNANTQSIINALLAFNKSAATNFPYFSQVQTATEILGDTSRNLTPLEDTLTYIGLLVILVGGFGVVNTMLVVVERRTSEIATVKALGLKPKQTLIVFSLEVLILGFGGSLPGLFIGEALGFGLKGIVEGIFGRSLEWNLYPAPILIGLIVGTLTAGLFGFLPAYAAARVSPAVVLRQAQSSNNLPRIGNWATLSIILATTIAGGLMAGILVGQLALGMVIAFVTLLACLILVALMYLVVFLISRLPALFGPNFKMALRGFTRHRTRSATTLLVIVVSLFFISLISIVSDSIKTTLQSTFSFNLGFDAAAVDVFGTDDDQLQTTFQQELPGLHQIFMSNDIEAIIQSVNQQPLNTAAALQDNTCGSFLYKSRNSSNGNLRLKPFIQLSGRSLPASGQSISPNGPQQVLAGRTFTPADADKRVLVVQEDEARCYGIKVGDTVTMRLRSNNLGGISTTNIDGPVQLQVIGIVSKGTAGTNFEQGFVAPFKLIDTAGAQFSIFFMQIDPTYIKQDLTKVQGYLLYKDFVFDLTGLIDTFTGLLNQVLAFPLLLSLLSLLAGSLLIANNVALAMLERRTEVGVLKAIGAKRKRIISILLWESGLLGLVGGLLGISSSLLVALVLPGIVRNANRNFNLLIYWSPVEAFLILALGIGLTIIGTLFSAWRAVQEKPLVVLRYE